MRLGRPDQRRGALLCALALLAVMPAAPASARTVKVPAGFDLFSTVTKKTNFSFTEQFAIPADFFGPGSEPFEGKVKLEGVPLMTFDDIPVGDADTIVRRRAAAKLSTNLPSRDTVPIELVALHLQSVDPIMVPMPDGTLDLWDIDVGLSASSPSKGSMTIVKKSRAGGTFDSTLNVMPLFTFTREADDATRTLDVGALDLPKAAKRKIRLKATKVPWVHNCPKSVLVIKKLGNDDFCAGATKRKKKLTVEQAKLAQHGVKPVMKLRREIDKFPVSLAIATVTTPFGVEDVRVEGPTKVRVGIDDIRDRDGDGLEEVQTEILSMELTGSGSFGPITIRVRDSDAHPNQCSCGEIEERTNLQDGRLDLAPFVPPGSGPPLAADSFFDVFFEVETGLGVFHSDEPKHMTSVITHKPPDTGEFYFNPDELELFNENDEPTGLFIGAAKHVPDPEIERDFFPESSAVVAFQGPAGTEQVRLKGPTMVHVNLSGLADIDGDGLEEVPTEMVSMDLTGNSSLGPLRVTMRDPGIHPDQRTFGAIEEQNNATPGVLDVPPFTASGQADSFFDVFFEVEIAGLQRVHNNDPKRMTSVITHKPPAEGEFYFNPDQRELFDESDNPTGFFIGSVRHTPRPEIEKDFFPNSSAVVTIKTSSGNQQVRLSGPTMVHVNLSDLADTDGDGREEVPTEIVSMDLTGTSALGPVRVQVRDPADSPFQRSLGEIEEQQNNTPGTLDLPPFTSSGAADSFFDVFFDIRVGDLGRLHNAEPKHMTSVITFKPPAMGEFYFSPNEIPLLNQNNQPSGISLGDAKHTPDPEIEKDFFPNSLAQVPIETPSGTREVLLKGPTMVHVNLSDLADTDGDGREEVPTEIVSMDLTQIGGDESLGPISVTLRDPAKSPFQRSLGVIEETSNDTPGVLDIPPFTSTGTADSFFDVFFEIEVGSAGRLHNDEPKHMATVITFKPPARGDTYFDPVSIPLLNENEQPSGFSLGSAIHVPDPGSPPQGFLQAELQPPFTDYFAQLEDFDGDPLEFQWQWDLSCGTLERFDDRTYFWDHGDNVCPHNTTDHPGTIRVDVFDGTGWQTVCIYEGSQSGQVQCNERRVTPPS